MCTNLYVVLVDLYGLACQGAYGLNANWFRVLISEIGKRYARTLGRQPTRSTQRTILMTRPVEKNKKLNQHQIEATGLEPRASF
jgi:hypothetical protein